jgi:hypothetical protein
MMRTIVGAVCTRTTRSETQVRFSPPSFSPILHLSADLSGEIGGRVGRVVFAQPVPVFEQRD